MVRFGLVIGSILLLASASCDIPDRVTRLEKQNQEIKELVAKEKSAVTDFDLQGKCAKDAREWYGRNYVRDKGHRPFGLSKPLQQSREQVLHCSGVALQYTKWHCKFGRVD
jgi:hypothetical protein